MTGSPPPSGRSESAKSALLALFRPVLFVATAIGLTLVVLVAAPSADPSPSAPQPARKVADQRRSSPARSGAVAPDHRGGFPRASRASRPSPPRRQHQPADPEPPASDRYDLTLRLEKGDTIDKMLADIDVPEADRKQIDQALQAILKKRRIAAGEEIQLEIQTPPGPSGHADGAVAVGAAPTRARVRREAPGGRQLHRRGKDLSRQPAHRAGRGRAQRLAAAERHRRAAPRRPR